MKFPDPLQEYSSCYWCWCSVRFCWSTKIPPYLWLIPAYVCLSVCLPAASVAWLACLLHVFLCGPRGGELDPATWHTYTTARQAHVTDDLSALNPHLVKIKTALTLTKMLIRIIRSWNNFAQFMTANLLCHVQICDLTGVCRLSVVNCQMQYIFNNHRAIVIKVTSRCGCKCSGCVASLWV